MLTHAPRGPHRRRALPAARAPGHPGLRLAADPGPARGQAARAPDQGRPRIEVAEGAGRQGRPVRASSSSRSTTRSPTRWPWPSTPPAGTVLHTGDFKLDQLPLDGRITDLRAFARLGERGRRPVHGRLHQRRGPRLRRQRARHRAGASTACSTTRRGRIVVACFASHIHRVQQIIDVAHRHDRKVAFFGRSMVRNMGVASDLGYLDVPGGILVVVGAARRAARRRGRAHLHRLAGRADGGAVADRQQRPPDQGRPRRHRGPRVVADPGQRERRVAA